MSVNSIEDQFLQRKKQIEALLRSSDIRTIIGVEAVNHYQESFANEGFTDKNLQKWKEVKRRNSFSKWYGHSGQTGKFSTARTTAPILTGETGELMNAIRFVPTAQGVTVINAKKYARVHNFGGMAKIYGKKPFTMPKRTFMAPSTVLNEKIRAKIVRELKRRLNTI